MAGLEGARLLRRTAGDETEFVSLTYFDDLDAVRAFTGPDYETAVVADHARGILVRFDDRQPLRNGLRNLMISRIWGDPGQGPTRSVGRVGIEPTTQGL